jgi:hypothetical protein
MVIALVVAIFRSRIEDGFVPNAKAFDYHGLRMASYHFLTPFLSTISKTIGWCFGFTLEILNAFDIRLRAAARTSSRSV